LSEQRESPESGKGRHDVLREKNRGTCRMLLLWFTSSSSSFCKA